MGRALVCVAPEDCARTREGRQSASRLRKRRQRRRKARCVVCVYARDGAWREQLEDTGTWMSALSA
eukprot:2861141-Pleurochrysis_carterae.AAC.4